MRKVRFPKAILSNRAVAFSQLLLASVVLSACAGIGTVPPVAVDTSASPKPEPGTYAAMVPARQWVLTTESGPYNCGPLGVYVDANGSYQDAMRQVLRRSLEHVTFVSAVMTPEQMRTEGYDAQVVVSQGKADSAMLGTMKLGPEPVRSNVALAVTITILDQRGGVAERTITGHGRGKGEGVDCRKIVEAIGDGARTALSAMTRQSTAFLRENLNQRRVAKATPAPVEAPAPPPKPVAAKPKAKPEPPRDTLRNGVTGGAVAVLDDKSAGAPAATVNPPKDTATLTAAPKAESVALSATRPNPTPPPSSDSAVGPEEAFIRGVNAAAGRGGGKSDVEAARWFRIAAAKGYAPAQNNLGFLYAEGRGVARSDAEAVKWYKRAADRDYPPAQTSLGMMYAAGRGVKQSDFEALALYSAAANQGYGQAKANLAEMYGQGRGVTRDVMTANFLLGSVREKPFTGSGVYVEPVLAPEAYPGQ